MKFKPKQIILTLAACIAASSGFMLYLSKPINQELQTEALIIGISPDFPPFTFMNGNELAGFDIDVIQEVCKRIGKPISFKIMPFTTLLPSLQLGSLHVVAAGLTATPERAKSVLFTKPYIENNALIILSLASDPIASIKQLYNHKVIVNQGYSAAMYMSKIPNIELIQLQTVADAFLALKFGQGAAFVTAQNTVKPYFDQYGSEEFVAHEIPETEENCSLAVAPQYPELLTEIQKALDSMSADNTLNTFKAKWGLS